MTKDELKTKASEAVSIVKTKISTIVEKFKNLATWKKALIIGSVCLVLLGANDLGFYIAGTKTCKPTAPPTLQETGKEKTVINKPKEKNIVCGEKIQLDAVIIKDKIKVTGKDNCKMTEKYFDLNYNCLNPKWSVFFAPGFMVNYDTIGKKVYPMLGGGLGFQRHWGNFSLGPEVLVYSTLNKQIISTGANLRFEFRW